MATKESVPDTQVVSEELEDFRALQARLLANGAVRVRADIERAKQLGLIDEYGNRISKEWPADMQPGAKRDFGG